MLKPQLDDRRLDRGRCPLRARKRATGSILKAIARRRST
jgi:hypothetical protein